MPPWVVPAAIAAGGAIINAIQRGRERRFNEGYQKAQNEYNDPASQMQRYQSAGLNKALVYSQGNPGNQSAALSAPSMSQDGSQMVQSYNQSSLQQSQVAAQGAAVKQKEAMTEVNKLQAEVLRNNPYLDSTYLQSVISSMVSTATQKANDAKVSGIKTDWFSGDQSFKVDGVEMHGPAGVLKMETELKTLIQKFDLGAQDQKVKAQIIQSKEFQNALSEIQLKWLQDGSVTPQHIFQGIMLLLTKMF